MLILDVCQKKAMEAEGWKLDAYLKGVYDEAVHGQGWKSESHPRAPKGAPDSHGGQFVAKPKTQEEMDKPDNVDVSDKGKMVVLPSGKKVPKTFADYLHKDAEGNYVDHKESPFLRKMKGNGRVSEELSSILDRLFGGEDVPDEEIKATAEWQDAMAREAQVASILKDKFGVESTHEIDTPERKALQQAIKRAALNPHITKYAVIPEADGAKMETNEGLGENDSYEVEKGKKVFIAIGYPAAGKSTTYANPLAQKYKARLCDSDIIKKVLPEFANGYGGNLVHQESSDLNEQIIDEASDRGDNIVYPILGFKAEKLKNAIEYFRSKGYSVNLCFKDMPRQMAKGRLLVRFLQKGRYLPLTCISKVGDRLPGSFEANKGLCDAYIRSTNPNPYGGKERELDKKGDII